MTLSKASRVPVASLALIVLTLVAAFFTLTNPDSLLRWGYIPEPLGAPTFLHRAASAFTSLFVHLDPLHLLGNMLVLAAVGPAVERAAGPVKLLLVFFVAGLIGVAAHHLAVTTMLTKIAGDPLAGSSAAIAGLIGFAWLRFHRTRVPLLPNIWAPVWVVILAWLVLQAAGAWFSASQFGATTSYIAHLAGFVAGFALAFPLGAATSAADEAWQEHQRQAAQRGSMTHAAVLKQRVESTEDFDSMALLGANLEESGDKEEAAQTYAKLMRNSPKHAAAAAIRLALLSRFDTVPRIERLRIARSLSDDNPEAAALILDSVAAEPDDTHTASALEALLELHADKDERAARAAKRRLLAEYSLSPEADRARPRHPEL
ncbi:MAG: rhomboid family intramembrane serine protease [Armatimonadota bacterium]|nr:rhomboid family intramembrane serine protease [Armatimonadota bacterium]